jgi:GNAT superfamily N-acetyltransferase
MPAIPRLTFHPLTPDRFPDLERLFGPRGASGGCWCIWWKLSRPEFDAGKGEGNRRALEVAARGGTVPGLLAYAGAEPVGWVAIEPREAYPRFLRSRTLAPVDDAPVWSITCFFVARAWRGKGVTSSLIEAAVKHARRGGARAVEAYPVDPSAPQADAFVYTGIASTFLRAGFREVARRSATRPILRRAVRGGPREMLAAQASDGGAPAGGSARRSRQVRQRIAAKRGSSTR